MQGFPLFLFICLFIHNHVALANERVMWAIDDHGGNRRDGMHGVSISIPILYACFLV